MASLMPKVKCYPLCSACKRPYVLRFVLAIFPKAREEWLWQRDCKHRKAPPVSSTAPEGIPVRAS